MECKEEGCNGHLDKETPISLMTGCRSNETAFPCDTCRRLYWGNGSFVFNRRGQKVFFKNGSLTLK